MKSAILPILVFLSALAPASGWCGDYTVRPGKECKVVFVSRASLEKFEGKTDQLETAKFPKAVFEGGTLRAAGARLEAGKPESLQVEGTFTLHGVARRIRITVAVTLRPDPAPGAIDFSTQFPVALADYAIGRPQFLFLKLADVQVVRVSGRAHAVSR